MKRLTRLITPLLALAIAIGAAPFALAGDDGNWSGFATETPCGAAGAPAAHADCAVKCVKEKGAKWAIYNPEDKQVFVLSGDDAMMAKMSSMAGKKVKIKGTMDKEKKVISVATMEQAG
jgi:hypothetical protein